MFLFWGEGGDGKVGRTHFRAVENKPLWALYTFPFHPDPHVAPWSGCNRTTSEWLSRWRLACPEGSVNVQQAEGLLIPQAELTGVTFALASPGR